MRGIRLRQPCSVLVGRDLPLSSLSGALAPRLDEAAGITYVREITLRPLRNQLIPWPTDVDNAMENAMENVDCVRLTFATHALARVREMCVALL